jgi:glyoxylase-like metal-dependent hydrolase (beta-lactamase superfamily II)
MTALPSRVVSIDDARQARLDPALAGLHIFERGWLSSNNVLIHGGGAGAVLVDSSHCLHGEQTVALVQQALETVGRARGAPTEPLAAVLNTHLHSDHCGGNAALQRAFDDVPVFVPAASWEAVRTWDEDALTYRATAQCIERFTASGTLQPGETLRLGDRSWQVLAAPGHDPDSVILFDATHGLLISADALWENGFGVVFPELEGDDAFDQVAEVIDLIEDLPVRWVVPGHGRPFQDIAGALQRARRRLAGLRGDPARHRHHAAKVLLKYHLLEEQRQSVARLHLWASGAPLLRTVWERQGRPEASLHAWVDRLVDELTDAGAVQRAGDTVCNL